MEPTNRTTPKSAPDSPPTPASAWKKKTVRGTPVRVPSGNTALLVRRGMDAFLQEGVIPNGLMPLVPKSMKKGQPPSDADMAGWVEDPEKLKQIVELADAITIRCCIDPVVQAVPKDDAGNILPPGHAGRDENILYIDEVEFNDKMFIFSWAVGGTADLEKFREESAPDVGSVPEEQTLEH
jgi:hypothetical protein